MPHHEFGLEIRWKMWYDGGHEVIAMTKKERAQLAVDALKELYPDGICSLEYDKDYELLFAVRLSAQCTDARVNLVPRPF